MTYILTLERIASGGQSLLFAKGYTPVTDDKVIVNVSDKLHFLKGVKLVSEQEIEMPTVEGNTMNAEILRSLEAE